MFNIYNKYILKINTLFIKENICNSVICLNNGICSLLNASCLCLTQEYFGESCQYCKYIFNYYYIHLYKTEMYNHHLNDEYI